MYINFNFSKWRKRFSMKKVIMNFVQWILDLSYNTRQLQSVNEGFFCLQATSDCVNCVMAAGFMGF